MRSVQRENGLISSSLHLVWWSAVRGYLALWHRLAVTGQHHLPTKAPFILVANHCSHLDVLALAAPLSWRLRDRIFPIAAGDVFFETPRIATFSAGMLNALPMWRKQCGPHALEQLRQRLIEQPCAYIIFPEGTRSRDGTMAPFKFGLGMMVAETEVPVVPCHLEGCYEAWKADQRWPLPRPIRLRIGQALTFAHVANHREGWCHIAATMEERVKALAAGSPTGNFANTRQSECDEPP